MSSTNAVQTLNKSLSELANLLENIRLEGNLNEIEDSRMQKLIESVIRLYVAKIQNDDEYQITHKIKPLPSQVQVTQTETAMFIDQLLKQMEIEVFELQMWRSMR